MRLGFGPPGLKSLSLASLALLSAHVRQKPAVAGTVGVSPVILMRCPAASSIVAVHVPVTRNDVFGRARPTWEVGAGPSRAGRGGSMVAVEKRLATFDGILAVSSPVGGPTMVVMEVPCALSLQKISSC